MSLLDVFCARDDEFTLVKASGEMDYHNFRILKTSVEQALADGDRYFIFNLADLAYLDSSALGSLLYHQKRIRDHDGHMVVISGQALTDILNLTHLDSYFNIVESVDAGRRWLVDAKKAPKSNVSNIKTRG